VQIRANNKDTIEVIYIIGFGDVSGVALGSDFETCGD
jgi:hypothetical protein